MGVVGDKWRCGSGGGEPLNKGGRRGGAVAVAALVGDGAGALGEAVAAGSAAGGAGVASVCVAERTAVVGAAGGGREISPFSLARQPARVRMATNTPHNSFQAAVIYQV